MCCFRSAPPRSPCRWPPAVRRGYAYRSGVGLGFEAAPDAANRLRVYRTGDWYVFSDVHAVAAGAGCSPIPGDPGSVRCAADGVTVVYVTLHDGDDSLGDLSGLPAVVSAGDGADTVDAGDGDDTVAGDAGNDRISGGPGTDSLFGAIDRPGG